MNAENEVRIQKGGRICGNKSHRRYSVWSESKMFREVKLHFLFNYDRSEFIIGAHNAGDETYYRRWGGCAVGIHNMAARAQKKVLLYRLPGTQPFSTRLIPTFYCFPSKIETNLNLNFPSFIFKFLNQFYSLIFSQICNSYINVLL